MIFIQMNLNLTPALLPSPSSSSGYWPLIDRFNNYWMQIVYNGPAVIGCIDGWVARGVIKPVVDAVMVSRVFSYFFSFTPSTHNFRFSFVSLILFTYFPPHSLPPHQPTGRREDYPGQDV